MNKERDQTTKVPPGENASAFSLFLRRSKLQPLASSLRQMQNNRLQALLLVLGLVLVMIEPVRALPNVEDTPEEVLRSEIITGARSPLDGKPMTASEYAQLQAELQTPAPSRPQLGRTIEKNLNLLRLRKFIKTFFPFLPVP